ncbi:delta subunit of the central stalk of mitochondrial F1F0 ATP synthase, atp16 [Diatrype stigma]|uniref:ATP synthase subunit delta, mitochondrial n=1 Tax=Diatrype stigma TaxID=117547 RepID=A0AAN9U9G5_9PEZI
MNTLRVARTALRARPTALRVPLQRRTYAEAASEKIRLSLSLPHQSIFTSKDVVQVNIPAESGEMGVLANHVPSIEQLKPGLIEVIEESGSSKQFFLSGGFATVQPNSVLSINAVEGYPLEDFSAEAVKAQLAEAQKVANGSGSEQDIAEAKIELEVRAEQSNPSHTCRNTMTADNCNSRFWRVWRLPSNRLYNAT